MKHTGKRILSLLLTGVLLLSFAALTSAAEGSGTEASPTALTLDVPVDVAIDAEIHAVYFTFTAPESGWYIFTSDGGEVYDPENPAGVHPRAYLIDARGKYLDDAFDDEINYHDADFINFCFRVHLGQNELIRIRATADRPDNNQEVQYTATVSKYKPAFRQLFDFYWRKFLGTMSWAGMVLLMPILLPGIVIFGLWYSL